MNKKAKETKHDDMQSGYSNGEGKVKNIIINKL